MLYVMYFWKSNLVPGAARTCYLGCLFWRWALGSVQEGGGAYEVSELRV